MLQRQKKQLATARLSSLSVAVCRIAWCYAKSFTVDPSYTYTTLFRVPVYKTTTIQTDNYITIRRV